MTNSIKDILQSQRKIYLSITGGGTRVISELLERGGASGVFMGARVPYSMDDLASFIMGTSVVEGSCCSKATADLMAKSALYEAFSCHPVNSEVVGLGCTASLCRHEGEREGRVNQAYICITSQYKVMEVHVEFHNSDDYHTLGRKSQEDMLSTLILGVLADFVSSSRHIESHTQSNPYVRIQCQGKKLGFAEKKNEAFV